MRTVLLKDVSFKWLLSGAALSMLGDQFTLIALPWLVLKMTRDTLALGIALALIGVPRALFMLIGGRTCFLYWAAIALFISGPIQVAMPVLANTMNHGVAAFGILVGAHGAGTLIGMIFSGARPNMRVGSLGMTILAVDGMIGMLIASMAVINTTWTGAVVLLLIGMLGGFVHIAVFTWMQRRVSAFRMGRTMSLFMFIFMGIAPVSAALTGWLMRSVTVGQLFAGSGVLLFVIALIALLASPMRAVSDFPLKN